MNKISGRRGPRSSRTSPDPFLSATRPTPKWYRPLEPLDETSSVSNLRDPLATILPTDRIVTSGAEAGCVSARETVRTGAGKRSPEEMKRSGAAIMTIDGEHPIVLYDGLCGLCDKSVRFVLSRDRADCFRFAALQSPLAAGILSKHGIDPARLESVRVVVDPGKPNERVLSKTRAILYILDRLGGIWRIFAPFRLFPDVLLNVPYAFIARVRYRVFGRHDLCAVPKPEWRAKFLDAPAT